ncbi:MAG: outer membrane lipoprotein LolB [Rubrivivax sp.]
MSRLAVARSWRRALRGLLAPAVAMSLLAACATPQPVSGGSQWISGRMAVRVAASPQRIAQSFNAAFDLQGDGRQGELRLSSPLGTRLATARWAPGLAALQTSDGEQRFADLDQLSMAALGEALPLAALSDWLEGRPWAGAPSAPTAGGFEQMGWTVQTEERAIGAISFVRAAAPAVQVRVRLDSPA